MIEKWVMQRADHCRPCGAKLKRGALAIKTSAYGGQDTNVYICMNCARDIAKISLATEDLEAFGQELVMDKLQQ